MNDSQRRIRNQRMAELYGTDEDRLLAELDADEARAEAIAAYAAR